MIAYLLKNWKLLLDLILVVGGIILLAIVDPFGMFSKAKLKSTANLVSSVKDIGELVTAEYYGEVISSLHETIIYSETPEELTQDYENCLYSLKELIISEAIKDDKKKFRLFKKKLPAQINNSDALKKLIAEFDADKTYTEMIAFLATRELDNSWDKYYRKSNKTLKGNAQLKVLNILVDQLNEFLKAEKANAESLTVEQQEMYTFGLPTYFNELPEFHYQLLTDQQLGKRKNRKKDIVFIGRGWVKAGFRFDRLDESNFFYNKESQTIHFYGLNPVILDKDINPWFIPEKKVKGFELIDYYSGASFEEAKDVKKKCKEKLLEQAEAADILAQARINGEVALQSFFSLLLDVPDLKIEIKEFPNESMIKWMSADTLVTVEEALLMDSIYRKITADTQRPQAEIEAEKQEFKLMMNRLMKCDFVVKGTPFTFYSLHMAKYLKKVLYLSDSDYDTLKAERGLLELERDDGELRIANKYMDAHWFYADYNYSRYTRDFNAMVRLLDKQVAEVSDLRKDTLLIAKDLYDQDSLSANSLMLDTLKSINGKTVYAISLNNPDIAKFWNLHYPTMSLEPSRFDTLSMSDTTRAVQNKLFAKYVEAAKEEASKDEDIQRLLLLEIDVLVEYKQDSVRDVIKRRPIKSFIKQAKKFLRN